MVRFHFVSNAGKLVENFHSRENPLPRRRSFGIAKWGNISFLCEADDSESKGTLNITLVFVWRRFGKGSGMKPDSFTQRTIDRSEETFSYLFDTYSAPLYSIILHKLPDTSEAPVVLKNAFKKAWSQLDCYKPSRQSVFTWLSRITIDEIQCFVQQQRSESEPAGKETTVLVAGF